jgi:HEAT repeat protein
MTALAAETNRRLRARTVTLLRRVGGALVPPLVAALQDERWYLVRNAVFLLGDLGGPEQVEPVERCLVHPDPRVRREACRALPKLGGNDVEDLLIRALNDPDESVVAAGIEALGVLASPRGVGYMLDIVARAGSFADATDGLRKTAVDVLGRLQVAEAVDPLADVLLRRTLLTHPESPRVRAAALAALAAIGTAPALEVLENVASGDTSRRLREMADNTLSRVRQAGPRR